MYGGKDPREYCISTKKFVVDDEGKLKGLETIRVDWTNNSGRWSMEEVKGSEEVRDFLCAIGDGAENFSCSVLPVSIGSASFGIPRTAEGVHRGPWRQDGPTDQHPDSHWRMFHPFTMSHIFFCFNSHVSFFTRNTQLACQACSELEVSDLALSLSPVSIADCPSSQIVAVVKWVYCCIHKMCR